MGFFRQLFLLLWKNITYRRRNKVTTFSLHRKDNMYNMTWIWDTAWTLDGGNYFDASVTAPMFSSLADPADHRAPLAALPLRHPHLRASVTPSLQAEPMWVIFCNVCHFRHTHSQVRKKWVCANQLKRINSLRVIFVGRTHICFSNLLRSWSLRSPALA